MDRYKTGYCPGAFDMFHMGHLNLLRNAKSRCQFLIAGVVTDEVYRSYKLRPPVIPFVERLEIVAQCKYVDQAIGVDAWLHDKWHAWEKLRYDCHFAGSDHEGAWPELEKQLGEVGARLEFFPYTRSVSSTQIRKTLERDFIFQQWMGEGSRRPVFVLFGAGAITDRFLDRDGDGARPAFFVDNDPAKWGTAHQGILVRSPEVLRTFAEEELYVVICSRYAEDIAEQLVKMEIRDFRIFR